MKAKLELEIEILPGWEIVAMKLLGELVDRASTESINKFTFRARISQENEG